MNRKYLFFDIDGTLTNDNPGGEIEESTLQTLRKLEENGHFVAIATGRSYTLVQDAMKATGIKNVVCNGGNAIVLDGKLQYIHPLERNKALKVLHECLDKGFPFTFTINDSIEAYAYDHEFEKIMPNGGFLNIHVDNKPLEEYAEFHKLFIGLDMEHEKELESRTVLGYARYWPTWMIIEPDDKYQGIVDMIHMIGGKEEDIVVFGDGYNDLKMMEKAPLGIAMGNAIDELKEKASFVTLDNKHDGITYACKHFGWID